MNALGFPDFSNVHFDFEDSPRFLRLITPAEDVVESRRNDRRFKTVVCRHWVKGLCMKGEHCEFLHELNSERMPECRWGEKCQVPDCTFKHTKEADRLECGYYTLGFCAHGNSCKFRHIRKAKEELPSVANWDVILQNSTNQNQSQTQQSHQPVQPITSMETDYMAPSGSAQPQVPPNISASLKRLAETNENFKISLCKHFMSGQVCPYGETCHFAHGEHELRERNAPANSKPRIDNINIPLVPMHLPIALNDPKRKVRVPTKSPLDELIDEISNGQDTIPNPIADTGSDILTPDKDQKTNSLLLRVHYFIVKTESFETLAASVKNSIWAVHPFIRDKLNAAFSTSQKVILFFSVNDSQQFAGCALITSDVREVFNHPNINTPPEANGLGFCCNIEWQRTCVLTHTKAGKLLVFERELSRELPVALAFEGTELPPQIGHALLVMLFREPAVELSVDDIDPGLKLAVHPPGPAPQLIPVLNRTQEVLAQIESAKRAEKASNWVFDEEKLINPPSAFTSGTNTRVPVAPGCLEATKQGFIFAGDDFRLIDEMLGRLLFGVRREETNSVSTIEPGTIIFLLNLKNGTLFGVFEALDTPKENIDPMAFPSTQAKFHGSLLPIQVPVKVLMELKPISATDIAPHTMTRGAEAAFSTLTLNQTQQLINLLYIRSGLLDAFKAKNGDEDHRAPRQIDRDRDPNSNLPKGLPPNANDPNFRINFNPELAPGITTMPLQKPTTADGHFIQTVMMNIPFKPNYRAAHRVIGKGGIRLKHIAQETGVSCRVRGDREDSDKEILGPIYIVLQGSSEEAVTRAVQIAIKNAEEVAEQHDTYLAKGEELRQRRIHNQARG